MIKGRKVEIKTTLKYRWQGIVLRYWDNVNSILLTFKEALYNYRAVKGKGGSVGGGRGRAETDLMEPNWALNNTRSIYRSPTNKRHVPPLPLLHLSISGSKPNDNYKGSMCLYIRVHCAAFVRTLY